MRPPTDRTFVVAAVGLAAAALLCAAALVRALTFEMTAPTAGSVGVAAAPEVPELPAVAATVPSEGTLDMESLALAVDHDPFQPDRSRPEPYRLPGDEVVIETPAEPEPPPTPPFRVIGTALIDEGLGLALVQAEDGTQQMMKVGETLYGYRLQRVDSEAATVMGQGWTVTLMVESAALASAGADSRSNRSGRNAQTEAAAQLLQQLRERGLPAQFIEQLMQGRGRTGRAGGFQLNIRRTGPDTINLPGPPEPR